MQKTKAEKIGLSQTLKIALRALTVSYRTKSRLSLVVNILGFGAAFLPVAISIVLRQFTDQVQLLSQRRATVTEALEVLSLLVILYLIQTGYKFASSYFSEVDAQNTTKYIKKTIIDCTSKVEFKYIENEGDFRDKLEFAEMFGGTRVAESMQQTITVLQFLLTFISIVSVLLKVNVWIVVALLVTCIPAVILSILQKDETYKENAKHMTAAAMSVHLFYVAAGADEHCKCLADVRFCNIYPWLKKKWRSISDDFLHEKNDMTRRHVLCNSIADVLRNSVYICVLLFAASEIYRNPVVGLGTFMLVFTMAGQLQNATFMLFSGAAQFFGDIKYMKDFFDMDDTPREKLEKNPRDFESMDIVFDHVHFSYPNSDVEALEDISVTIRQGEKIAIVGENGSGKSTFVNLLCGMYCPSGGKITINGLDLSENLSAVRNRISTAFQSFGRYEATIRHNIAISDIFRNADDSTLTALAEKTGAIEFIRKQPNKFDEVVGTFSETGNNLSGGQWQKVAITRAAYRNKARVMLLDEPTAALDPIAESELYRDFSALTGDKTTILISHRLGITSVVDRILVFENGRIVEDGTHNELMDKNGKYAAMYRAQAQWYKVDTES